MERGPAPPNREAWLLGKDLDQEVDENAHLGRELPAAGKRAR
jgi:hypothetical protein